jgi:hypothetical protein
MPGHALPKLDLSRLTALMRIATFNIENLDNSDSNPSLQQRAPVLRSMLNRLDADILCGVSSIFPRRCLRLERSVPAYGAGVVAGSNSMSGETLTTITVKSSAGG